MISKALRVIMVARNEPFTDASINDIAVFHARQVEAACWASGLKMNDTEYKVLMMANAQRLCSAMVMATLRDAAQGELCHARVGTPDPALDGPAGYARLVRLERRRGIARPPDARAHPDHVRRQAGGGEKLQHGAVVDALHLDDRSFIRWAFMHEPASIPDAIKDLHRLWRPDARPFQYVSPGWSCVALSCLDLFKNLQHSLKFLDVRLWAFP